MKSRKPYSASPLVMFALGAGIALLGAYAAIYTIGSPQEVMAPSNDGIEWKTITIGDVVTFEVPAACHISAEKKFSLLFCPTEENAQPLPEMTFWTEGDTVSVYRYEDLETPYWDHIVASMTVIQPMERDITINIQK